MPFAVSAAAAMLSFALTEQWKAAILCVFITNKIFFRKEIIMVTQFNYPEMDAGKNHRKEENG